MELCLRKWNRSDFLVEIKAPHLDGLILGLGVAKELEELEEFDELDVLDELGEKNEVIDLVFLDDEGLGWLLRRFMFPILRFRYKKSTTGKFSDHTFY